MITTIAVIAACTIGATENVRIIEFTSQGCGACRQVAPVVERLRQSRCDIQQVDVDQQPGLAQDFGIREIPCFVIVRDDRIVDRWVGAASYAELSEFCQRANANPVVRGQTYPPDRAGTIVDHLRERAAFAQRQDGDLASGVSHQAPDVARPQGLVGSPTLVTHQPPPGAPVYPDFSAGAPPPNQASSGLMAIPAQLSIPDAQISRGPSDVTRSGSANVANPIDQALQATVRVRIEDDQGHTFGTGTVIDIHDHEALILTCGHLFRSSGGRGRITCDFFAAGGTTVEGSLICYDIRRDVGLISARTNREILPVHVGGNGRQPQQGDRVFSVGCNHGESPSVIENRILAVNRYHGPANLVVGGRPVDGRSGGGLFADDGTLIGVCNAADEQQDEGLYAALGPIHAELDRAGLAFVYRPHEPSLASQPRAGDSGVAPSQFLPEGSGTAANAPASLLPAHMPSPGQTDRAGDSDELICIIRSNKQGTDRVVVIDRPSSELISRLSQEVNQRGPQADTNMRVPAETPGWGGDWHGQ